MNLHKKLPPCGAFIKYVSKVEGQDVAEFIFKTKNVEPFLILKGENRFFHGFDQAGSLYYWISRRRKGLNGVTEIPPEVEYMDDFIDEMVREVPFIATCLTCGEQLSSDELGHQSDSRTAGWLHDNLLCRNGHKLLSVKVMHIMFKRKHYGDYIDVESMLRDSDKPKKD